MSPREIRAVAVISPAPLLPSITSWPGVPGVSRSGTTKPATSTASPTPVYASTCRTDSHTSGLRLSVGDDVRHEPRQIGGHEPVGLADAQPGRLHVHGPHAQHRAVAV